MTDSSRPSRAKVTPAKHHQAPDQDEFASILRSLYRQLRQANSLSLAFARGVMSGLGATVGVTFVLGFLVILLTQVARAFGVESWAQPLLNVLQ